MCKSIVHYLQRSPNPSPAHHLCPKTLNSTIIDNNPCQTSMDSCIEQEINAFLWVFLILTTAFLLHKLLKIFMLWAKARPIPGPNSPSFFGHCSLISGSTLSDLLSVSHKEYGPVVKLWLNPSRLLVSVANPQLIEEMLSKAADKLPLTGRALRLAFGRSSLFVSSYSKVENRRISLQKALSGELHETANVKQIVHSVIEKNQNISGIGCLDCEVISQHLAFTIFGATVFGDVFLTWTKAALYEELLVKIAKDSHAWASYSFSPFWKPSFRNYRDSCSNLKSLTEELVQKSMEKYKQDRLKGQISNSFEAFPSTNLIQNLFSWESDNCCGNNDEAFGDLISILFHGTLTTSGLISRVLARLVSHPEIQDKIYSEIITAQNVSQREDQLDTNHLPLLFATIYETARLLPAGTLLQRCSLEHDLNLKDGTRVPAGAILIVPLQSVQIDNSSWGNDASQFNPHRFLLKTHNGSDIQSPSFTGDTSYVLRDPDTNAAFLPFGSGAPACVGQRLAISSITTLFASLIKQYEVRLQPGSEYHVMQKMHNGYLNLLPNPKIIFIQRSS